MTENIAWLLTIALAYIIGRRHGATQRHKDIAGGMAALLKSGKAKLIFPENKRRKKGRG